MYNVKLDAEEVILIKEEIAYGHREASLVLTNKRMFFRGKGGLFRNNWKSIDEILLDDIKMYKGKVQIEKSGSTLTVFTTRKSVTFTCNNGLVARKIMEKVIDIKTGSTSFDRGLDRANDIAIKLKKAKPLIEIVGGVVLTAASYLLGGGKLPFGKK